MRRIFQGLCAFVICWNAIAVVPCEQWLRARTPIEIGKAPLIRIVEYKSPWKSIEANSEQRQPLYLGASPREIALGKSRADRPSLHDGLRALGSEQALAISVALGRGAGDHLELEAWPVQNDEGHLTWVFARFRPDAQASWQWLDAQSLNLKPPVEFQPAPILPMFKRTWVKSEYAELFTDVLKMKSLYEKPLFGDAVWTGADENLVIAAWEPTETREAFQRNLAKNPVERLTARILPQPARFNERPITFKIKVEGLSVRFPERIVWIEPKTLGPIEGPVEPLIQVWPGNFRAAYEKDVRVLSGRDTAWFPKSGRRIRFKRKNSIDPKNQLEDLVDYLEERYRVLGIKTVRQRFVWRGIPQSNLIAIIPGRLKGRANKPILIADHIDTAFTEDAFNRTGKRISAPGADDNVTASAALLRGAEVLRDSQPEHDIWLTHLTGEEFPADDLGARVMISQMLGAGQDIGGLVLMDMIGYRKRSDRVFQINAGESEASIRIAAEAYAVAKYLVPEWEPQLRLRFDPRSYLYNTDGIVFSNAGYPVILLNEHINGVENLNRPHYHATTDTVGRLDFNYASSIARVALETAARLAGSKRLPKR